MNELAIIFSRLEIDFHHILEAASTKWNFLPFKPGLVGGHCIGVDPYYLTHKAQAVGYEPEIILAGRRLNDGMGKYVALRLIKALTEKNINLNKSKILICGFTFKENCPDIRNTRVIDVIRELEDYKCTIDVYDPWVQSEDCKLEYGFELKVEPAINSYDAILLAVGHNKFIELGVKNFRAYGKLNHILFDLKSIFPISESDMRL